MASPPYGSYNRVPSAPVMMPAGARGSRVGLQTPQPNVTQVDRAWSDGEQRARQGQANCGGLLCGTSDRGEVVDGELVEVGQGNGEYVMQSSYQWVGPGKGNLTAPTLRRPWYAGCLPVMIPLCCLLFLGAVIGVLVWSFLPPSTTTTTTVKAQVITTSVSLPPLPPPPPHLTHPPSTTTTPAPLGECLMWGDPHIKTFDNGRPNFYGNGDHWILRSPHLQVQGRFIGTEFTFGLAATNKIIIGGPMLHHHTIEIGCMDCGPILADRNPVLPHRGTTFEWHDVPEVFIRYNSAGDLPDKANDDLERRAVHIHLPHSQKVTVFRWKNYIDVRIVVRHDKQIDGVCGNFNGASPDDTTREIMRRTGAQVSEKESLFANRPDIKVSREMTLMMQEKCTGQFFMDAQSACSRELPTDPPPSEALRESCLFNQCFGAHAHARAIAATYAA